MPAGVLSYVGVWVAKYLPCQVSNGRIVACVVCICTYVTLKVSQTLEHVFLCLNTFTVMQNNASMLRSIVVNVV